MSRPFEQAGQSSNPLTHKGQSILPVPLHESHLKSANPQLPIVTNIAMNINNNFIFPILIFIIFNCSFSHLRIKVYTKQLSYVPCGKTFSAQRSIANAPFKTISFNVN